MNQRHKLYKNNNKLQMNFQGIKITFCFSEKSIIYNYSPKEKVL